MKKLFFVGIGGIGMSALAIYAKKNNFIVFGSDKDLSNKTISLLNNHNITVYQENKVPKNTITNSDILIITNTIKSDHYIYLLAKKNNILILYRSQFLKLITSNKKIIGITGSHGKTTTTALLGYIFQESNYNPTIFVGGIMQNYDTNIKISDKSEYIIIEADDAYKSFLDIYSTVSIITTISYEHLETYKDMSDILKNFKQYAEQTNKKGAVIINIDDEVLASFASTIYHPNVITYGINNNADYQIKDIIYNNENSTFSLYLSNQYIGTYTTYLLGLHNIKNTTAAIITSLHEHINATQIQTCLSSYLGVERRFEYKGTFNNIKIYDDYAHHPTEINAVLSIIKQKNIEAYIYFQPHKFSRTKHLWQDFINVFTSYSMHIKMLYITDIYDVGEPQETMFTSEQLVLELKKYMPNVIYIPIDTDFQFLLSYNNQIKKEQKESIIITLGAGIMNKFSDKLKQTTC